MLYPAGCGCEVGGVLHSGGGAQLSPRPAEQQQALVLRPGHGRLGGDARHQQGAGGQPRQESQGDLHGLFPYAEE